MDFLFNLFSCCAAPPRIRAQYAMEPVDEEENIGMMGDETSYENGPSNFIDESQVKIEVDANVDNENKNQHVDENRVVGTDIPLYSVNELQHKMDHTINIEAPAIEVVTTEGNKEIIVEKTIVEVAEPTPEISPPPAENEGQNDERKEIPKLPNSLLEDIQNVQPPPTIIIHKLNEDIQMSINQFDKSSLKTRTNHKQIDPMILDDIKKYERVKKEPLKTINPDILKEIRERKIANKPVLKTINANLLKEIQSLPPREKIGLMKSLNKDLQEEIKNQKSRNSTEIKKVNKAVLKDIQQQNFELKKVQEEKYVPSKHFLQEIREMPPRETHNIKKVNEGLLSEIRNHQKQNKPEVKAVNPNLLQAIRDMPPRKDHQIKKINPNLLLEIKSQPQHEEKPKIKKVNSNLLQAIRERPPRKDHAIKKVNPNLLSEIRNQKEIVKPEIKIVNPDLLQAIRDITPPTQNTMKTMDVNLLQNYKPKEKPLKKLDQQDIKEHKSIEKHEIKTVNPNLLQAIRDIPPRKDHQIKKINPKLLLEIKSQPQHEEKPAIKEINSTLLQAIRDHPQREDHIIKQVNHNLLSEIRNQKEIVKPELKTIDANLLQSIRELPSRPERTTKQLNPALLNEIQSIPPRESQEIKIVNPKLLDDIKNVNHVEPSEENVKQISPKLLEEIRQVVREDMREELKKVNPTLLEEIRKQPERETPSAKMITPELKAAIESIKPREPNEIKKLNDYLLKSIEAYDRDNLKPLEEEVSSSTVEEQIQTVAPTIQESPIEEDGEENDSNSDTTSVISDTASTTSQTSTTSQATKKKKKRVRKKRSSTLTRKTFVSPLTHHDILPALVKRTIKVTNRRNHVTKFRPMLEKAFKVMATDGIIHVKDIKVSLNRVGLIGVKESEIEKMMATLDDDGNGTVSLDEFINACVIFLEAEEEKKKARLSRVRSMSVSNKMMANNR